jgi:hypothetical protein
MNAIQLLTKEAVLLHRDPCSPPMTPMVLQRILELHQRHDEIMAKLLIGKVVSTLQNPQGKPLDDLVHELCETFGVDISSVIIS